MKKAIALLLCICLTLAFSACGKGEEVPPQPDFRNAFWGMSQTKVAESEAMDYAFADDNIIFYTTQLEETGEDIEITYYFTDSALTSAELRFTQQEDRTIDDLIASYLALRDKVSAAYGDPVDPDYRVWLAKDPATEQDPDRLQIYYGRMEYCTRWETDTGSLTLTLNCQGQKLAYVLFGEAAPQE